MRTSRRPTADLPELAPGVTLVDVDDDLGVTPVQALLLDHILGGDGPAFWVVGANRANTTRLRELAPADRILDQVSSLQVHSSPAHVTSWSARWSSRLPGVPSVVVATGLDGMYRAVDVDDEIAEQRFIRAVPKRIDDRSGN